MAIPPFVKFYYLENYLFNEVQPKFASQGHLDAFDFFCIIIWKANRSKSRVAKRVLNMNSNLNEGVRIMTTALFHASDSIEKMKILMCDYGFRLPIASAILTVLFPDTFTVYDTRVCDTLRKFKELKDKTNFQEVWKSYLNYVEEVKAYEPRTLSLRDKDRFLWGKSFCEQLQSDITNNFRNET